LLRTDLRVGCRLNVLLHIGLHCNVGKRPRE